MTANSHNSSLTSHIPRTPHTPHTPATRSILKAGRLSGASVLNSDVEVPVGAPTSLTPHGESTHTNQGDLKVEMKGGHVSRITFTCNCGEKVAILCD